MAARERNSGGARAGRAPAPGSAVAGPRGAARRARGARVVDLDVPALVRQERHRAGQRLAALGRLQAHGVRRLLLRRGRRPARLGRRAGPAVRPGRTAGVPPPGRRRRGDPRRRRLDEPADLLPHARQAGHDRQRPADRDDRAPVGHLRRHVRRHRARLRRHPPALRPPAGAGPRRGPDASSAAAASAPARPAARRRRRRHADAALTADDAPGESMADARDAPPWKWISTTHQSSDESRDATRTARASPTRTAPGDDRRAARVGHRRRRRAPRRRLPAGRIDRARRLPGDPTRQAGARRGPGRRRQDRARQVPRPLPRPRARPPPVLRGARRGEGPVRVELPQAAAAHPGRQRRPGAMSTTTSSARSSCSPGRC